MSKSLFGTDGIRGVANEKLTPELCFQIGQAAGSLLTSGPVVIGRDTRRSGSMLGAALAAGFCSVGIDTLSVGICPTGGVSYIGRTGDYELAAVISASHNPAPDNGVKLIAHDGRKVEDEFEIEVERRLGQPLASRPTGGSVGLLSTGRDEINRYMDYLRTMSPDGLNSFKLVVDGSNGSAFELGPELFRSLGAEVIEIGCDPDGMNINATSGATKPEVLQSATKQHQADLGIAFDGDADRAVFSDREGNLINGDRMMAMWCAVFRPEPSVVVGTVMSNGGFEHYLNQQGFKLERVNVGDKYVSAKLTELGGHVGGEQSGHIIFPDRGPTGDGLITALELLNALKKSGRGAHELYHEFANWPQMLVNISVESKEAFQKSDAVMAVVEQAGATLGDRGRVNVRPSGTQPMVRVMVEADDVDLRDSAVAEIVAVMEREVGGTVYSRVDLTNALGD